MQECTVDLVCIGSGIGGLSAAITAAGAGLEVIVLEKTSKVGGVTALSYGELWIAPNDHERERGIEDSIEKAEMYMKFLSAGFAEDKLRRVYLERGSEALNYAAGNSVAYLDIGSGYQSGMANGRCMIYGYLAGLHCSL